MTEQNVYRAAKPQYMTIPAFAQHFGVSSMTIRRRVQAGIIQGHRIGHAVRIPVSEVKRYAEASRIVPEWASE